MTRDLLAMARRRRARKALARIHAAVVHDLAQANRPRTARRAA